MRLGVPVKTAAGAPGRDDFFYGLRGDHDGERAESDQIRAHLRAEHPLGRAEDRQRVARDAAATRCGVSAPSISTTPPGLSCAP
jgi:hypothetical protein